MERSWMISSLCNEISMAKDTSSFASTFLQTSKRAVERLNGAWPTDYGIVVNIAKSNGRSSYWRKVQPGRSFRAHYSSTPEVLQQKNNIMADLPTSGNGSKPNRKSYKQALCNEKTPEDDHSYHPVLEKTRNPSNMKSCSGLIEKETLHYPDKCVTGIARGYYETNTLMENFEMQGLFDIEVKKISGRQFLITFDE